MTMSSGRSRIRQAQAETVTATATKQVDNKPVPWLTALAVWVALALLGWGLILGLGSMILSIW